MCIRDRFQNQEIAAKKGLNIDKLLEKILLEAEILDLKANPDREATGTIIEASLDKGCLLYTSDAADERSSVDLGGRRIIKKKKKTEIDSSWTH